MKTLILVATLAVIATPALAQTLQPTPEQLHRLLDALPAADTNHDGFVTHQEWLAFRATQFGRFDRNHDGWLSTADAPPLIGGKLLLEAIQTFDSDHDRRVSKTEFVDGPSPAFDRLDADHNGVIDPLECKKAGDSR